jgi:cell wall-associated NlpC family hydrolase
MSTIAWVLILASVFVFRAVSKGRITNLPEDLSDGFLALLRGDTTELTSVLARTGDSATPDQGALTPEESEAWQGAGKAGGDAIGAIAAESNALAGTAMRLGRAAKGYRFGATGPDYYDCSGLMWRACQKLGYKGARFTTFTIQGRKEFQPVTGRTDKALRIGDIVVWPRHHMGVVTGPDRFYSARNPRSGISEASISGFRKDSPVYLRYIP